MDALVLQTDFGTDDGAVSAMKGVAFSVNRSLPIFDNTHGIEPYNIWEAGFRLIQAMPYWPEGTVFVSVVDPGVGSDRKSVVAKSKGRYIVTPDNGTLTFIAQHHGIDELREIDESVNRLGGSEESYTFHGRDVYAYTGARLAGGYISFEEVGPSLNPEGIVMLDCFEPVLRDDHTEGIIGVHDVRYGSLWTNIPRTMFLNLGKKVGDMVGVTIKFNGTTVYDHTMMYAHSFAEVEVGSPLLYVNSVDTMAIALNQASFAGVYKTGKGNDWHVYLR
ncbi:MAG: S-adenosyl-l-methionine hydroxide adenosyltransferase family protein [Eubacteriales bacterium]|nr:S-adenosyl-l-methionine hydroxide adenosyltransferase family protein [Eubacteriales bacterium]